MGANMNMNFLAIVRCVQCFGSDCLAKEIATKVRCVQCFGSISKEV